MRFATLPIVAALLSATALATLSAQTIVAEGPVVYGHHHFNTTDMAAQKRFYVDTLGGKLATIVGIGLALGELRRRTGSLWPPLLCHAVLNLIASIEALALR